MPENRIQEEFEQELKLRFQPLTHEHLLRLPEVEMIAGLKKSKIYSLVEEGKFPRPVRLGGRSVRWKASAIYTWINSLPTASVATEGAAA